MKMSVTLPIFSESLMIFQDTLAMLPDAWPTYSERLVERLKGSPTKRQRLAGVIHLSILHFMVQERYLLIVSMIGHFNAGR
jgi:hypothetical protein